ncbi:hypothetical protein D0Z00_004521 [Geotrichum galactomycetum]|uniref:Uncharacterized protein n=1 Tax=Geotrichum galactomycetum TaxID=27317 RepID=A0ACB6UY63_9ASCO|nr:hypothetical protein D0Z00_004521 [Geotrichum candidum]
MSSSSLLENEACDAPVKRNSWAYAIVDEVGLVSLFKSSWDVHLLIFMRFARLFAFGQASIFLVLFFKEHDIDESKTGLFMSATLAFLSMVVLKRERTAVMGWINIVKTLAQVCGPSMTGVLTKLDKQWICFLAAGSLKVLYDLGILGTFLKIKYDREHD